MNSSTKEIKEVCLHLLAARDHSKKELLQKLAVKGYVGDTALVIIDELAQEGWQSDLRYAESYARSRILKGYGPIRIAYELRQNGVVNIARDGRYAANLSGAGAAIGRDGRHAVNLDEIAEAAAGGWMALLEQVYSKKYRHDKELEAGEWAKRSRFLAQRGFTGAMIADLFEHLNIKLF